MTLSDYVDEQLYKRLVKNGDVIGQLRMLNALIPSDGIEQDTLMQALVQRLTAILTPLEPSYTSLNETGINAVISSNGRTLCVDCAVIELFDWDVQKFENVDKGKDTTFKDAHKNSFDLIHDESIQYEQFPGDFYKDGLNCERCGNTIIEPVEEDEEE